MQEKWPENEFCLCNQGSVSCLILSLFKYSKLTFSDTFHPLQFWCLISQTFKHFQESLVSRFVLCICPVAFCFNQNVVFNHESFQGRLERGVRADETLPLYPQVCVGVRTPQIHPLGIVGWAGELRRRRHIGGMPKTKTPHPGPLRGSGWEAVIRNSAHARTPQATRTFWRCLPAQGTL